MREKKLIFILSLALLLPLISCGKKSNPVPKAIAPVPGMKDLTGEVKDGALFLSFSLPGGSGKDDTTRPAGFTVLKSCAGCGGGFEPSREIRLDEKRGYTIQRGRVYFYDNDLRQGYEYAYRVIPFTANGVPLGGSNTISIRWEGAPPAPQDVRAAEGDGTVDLTWTKENDYRYNVYRFENGTYPLFPLNSELLTSPRFADSNLVNGRRYRYEVRAVRMAGSLRWEGEGAPLEATPVDRTPPKAPRELAGAKKDGGAELNWRENTEKDILGYNVYRIADGKTEKMTSRPVRENVFFDSKPSDNRYVSYYVTAVDLSGNESEPSREAIIILKE